MLIASGGPTALSPPSMLITPQSRLITCLNPIFSKCGFVQRKKAKAKGKNTGVHDGFHVPSYVLKHTLMGQDWPEGNNQCYQTCKLGQLGVTNQIGPSNSNLDSSIVGQTQANMISPIDIVCPNEKDYYLVD